MTIGINTLFLIPNAVGGTEYYLRSFLKDLETQDLKSKYIIFCNLENYESFSFANPNWEKVLCPVHASNRIERIIYEQVFFPNKVMKYRCDLLHSFGYVGPQWGNFKKIVTVHDANWKDCPEDSTRITNYILNLLIFRSIKTANKVITDSEFSLLRLGHYFPQYKKKIKIVEPGIDDAFYQTDASKLFIKNQKYLLCVSAFYHHKNIPYLLKLWKGLNKHLPDYKLILIGQNGIDAKKVKSLLKQTERIEWYQKVSFHDLINYYQNCQLFVFPSIYEGFGYPVYEALASGKKVIVGKRKLYKLSLQPELAELTFSLEKDTTQILEILNRKTKVKRVPIFKNNIKELLNIYHHI